MNIALHLKNAILWQGDCRELSESKEKFHALLCDPPYELGFMGKKWDKSGIAFQPETWASLARHLHPGAFGMAFAAARGWHRLACAIEDAGMIIHPTIFGWAYGSGFPKATRIDTAVDKAMGAEREKVRTSISPHSTAGKGLSNEMDERLRLTEARKKGYHEHAGPIPITETAKAWVGHRYGLQALKPALEPIIVFQKPYEEKAIESIVKTGAGALNIDRGRVRTIDELNRTGKFGGCFGNGGQILQSDKSLGRWPTNFILMGEDAVRALDKQSGESISPVSRLRSPDGPAKVTFSLGRKDGIQIGHNDSGGASRFFFTVRNQLNKKDPVCYCSKTSSWERETGCGDLPFHTPGEMTGGREEGSAGLDNPRAGAGRTSGGRNLHPTLKPLDLTRYLATLLLPPDEYAPRRILVPFAGAGSEMIGALQAGWDKAVGIELEAEYCQIAAARIKCFTILT